MQRLRDIREQAGYSQQELADDSGVSQHTISAIELGRRKPQGRTLRKLAEALDVNVADLLGEGWQQAFDNSLRFRADAKARLGERLVLWEAARDEEASDEMRRRLLDEVGLVLDGADEVLRKLLENLSEGLDRMSEPGLNPYWAEIQKVETLYHELLSMVESAGLSVRPKTPSDSARLRHHELDAIAG